MSERLVIPPLDSAKSPVDDLLRIADRVVKLDPEHPLVGALVKAAEICLEDYQRYVKAAHVVVCAKSDNGLGTGRVRTFL